jgi:pimeloyl-ACP methyl ester carboxylesterase
MIATTHIVDATLETYLGPLIQDPGVRSDLARLLGSVSNRYTIEAAQSFPGFDRPVLIVWGLSDPFFSPRLALRLKHDFPDARLEAVPGSRALVSEDRPERLAQLIGEFLEEVTGQPRDGSREVFREIDTDCNTLVRTV